MLKVRMATTRYPQIVAEVPPFINAVPHIYHNSICVGGINSIQEFPRFGLRVKDLREQNSIQRKWQSWKTSIIDGLNPTTIHHQWEGNQEREDESRKKFTCL